MRYVMAVGGSILFVIWTFTRPIEIGPSRQTDKREPLPQNKDRGAQSPPAPFRSLKRVGHHPRR